MMFFQEAVEEYHYDVNSQPIAPGMKYKHYAPDTPVTMLMHLSKPIKTIKEWSKTAFILPETLSSMLQVMHYSLNFVKMKKI